MHIILKSPTILRTLNSLPPAQQPAAKECVFIATHEPCSLCLSGQSTIMTRYLPAGSNSSLITGIIHSIAYPVCMHESSHDISAPPLPFGAAITWSGFDNFYYLFSYTDTKDAFNIPHDLKILKV